MSIEIGKMNDLPLVRMDEKGGFLDAGAYGEVFLPLSQLPENPELGILISVFCYMDDGRLTVTAKRPKALLGELAKLTVKSALRGAAYLEWGIRKDLMVPFMEQRFPMKEEREYIVYVAKDRDDRLFGTTKFNRYISDVLPENSNLKEGDAVDLIAVAKTPLGIKMVVNNKYYAMLMSGSNDTSEIRLGVKTRGYILTIRKDRKINVGLHKTGKSGIDSAGFLILNMLKNSENGFLPFTDKTDPIVIEENFGMSKGKFKKAIGGLYKERKIEIKANGIQLLDSDVDTTEHA